MGNNTDIAFLQWALPKMGYLWDGFRKPRSQVLKRIRNRMYELELSGGYAEYKAYLENNPEEWNHLDRICNVTISKFFRDRKLWDYLRDYLFPELFQSNDYGPLRIWSAGCCNGEEPYSIAIIAEMLSEKSPCEKEIIILATDRYTDVLDRARQGIYPAGALQELTDREIRTFFEEIGEGDKRYRIKKHLKRVVEFDQRDIRESLPGRFFDLVFCRNLVFTYCIQEYRNQFLQQLKNRIKPNGFLVIGSNETLPETEWLEKISKTHPVYRKTGSPYP